MKSRANVTLGLSSFELGTFQLSDVPSDSFLVVGLHLRLRVSVYLLLHCRFPTPPVSSWSLPVVESSFRPELDSSKIIV